MNDLRGSYECIVAALKLAGCRVVDVETNGSFGSGYTTLEDPQNRNIRIVLDRKENWIACELSVEGTWLDLLPPLRNGTLDFRAIREAIGLPLNLRDDSCR
jgi:hypothetical protein